MNIKQKKIIRISAICLLVILFVLAGAEIWITRKIEAAIEHTIREQGGVPNKVHVGSISIYPLNRTIRLKHLVFGIDFPAKGTRFDLQMDRLTAGGIRLQGKEGIEFGSIDLDSPVVTLSRRTGKTLTDTIRHDTTKSSDLHSKFKDVLPGSIRVTDGSIRITEEKGGQSITHSIQHLSFSTSQLSDMLSTGSSRSTATDLRLSIRQIQYQFDENAMQLEADTIVINSDSIHISALRLLPLYEKDEFAALAPGHEDWMQITSQDINGYGVDLNEWIIQKNFTADSIDIGAARIESYKNRNIAQVQRIKPLFFQLLGRIPHPVDIQTIGFRNLQASYSELAPGKSVPGTLSFDKISGACRGITNRPDNSGQMITLGATGLLQNTAQMQLDLAWPVDTTAPHFVATGSLGSMNLSLMNRMTEPIADLQIDSGEVNRLTFRITGDSIEAETELTLLYDDLQIELLHLKEGKIRERKLLSTVLDDLVLIPNNPHLGQTRIGTGTTLRDPYRSQFNYLWKSIETGIKSTLIGRHPKHDRPHRPSRKRF